MRGLANRISELVAEAKLRTMGLVLECPPAGAEKVVAVFRSGKGLLSGPTAVFAFDAETAVTVALLLIVSRVVLTPKQEPSTSFCTSFSRKMVVQMSLIYIDLQAQHCSPHGNK